MVVVVQAKSWVEFGVVNQQVPGFQSFNIVKFETECMHDFAGILSNVGPWKHERTHRLPLALVSPPGLL